MFNADFINNNPEIKEACESMSKKLASDAWDIMKAAGMTSGEEKRTLEKASGLMGAFNSLLH